MKLKLAQSRLCRPCFTKVKFLTKVALAQNDLKKEYRVDHLLKKLKVLEGIVRENVLQQDELKWNKAYIKYSLFKHVEEDTQKSGDNYIA